MQPRVRGAGGEGYLLVEAKERRTNGKVVEGQDRDMTKLLELAEWQFENTEEPKYYVLEVMDEMDKLNKEDIARDNGWSL